MNTLNFPTFNFKFQGSKEHPMIYDVSRKKYVKLTPEEWVRQHLVEYLKQNLQYPEGLLATEMGFKHLKMDYRADVVVYDTKGQPLLLAEVKAPEVNVSAKTFEQIFRYNHYLKAPYLVISNGIKHYCCFVDFEKNESTFLTEIPNYKSILK